MLVLGSFSISMSAWVGDQGLTGRGFLLRDGTGRVLAKKFGYRDRSGRVVRQFERQKAHMGQIPQDRKNEQNVAYCFIIRSSTLTKRFDFSSFLNSSENILFVAF